MLTVTDLWVRAAPPHMTMTAAYGELTNDGDEPLMITSVTASNASKASIHETQLRNDRAMMRPVDGLELQPQQSAVLAPGGIHIMLMNITTPLEIGQSVDICFILANEESVCTQGQVQKQAMNGGHHQ